MHFVWHDIQHGLFHFDSGILYTAKQLFTRPGHAIREFIEGKRVRYFKPVSFVVILATLYGLLYHNYHLSSVYEVNIAGEGEVKDVVEKINEWIGAHYSWATLLTLPFYTTGSFLAFKKQEYNFTEHLVLNTFLAGQRIILHIVAFPLVYHYTGSPSFETARGILGFLDFILLGWGYIQFFNKLPKIKAILLTVLSFFIFILTVLTASILTTMIIIKIVART
ncbi:MAG: DUF3667 domain-containing protein [Bacteroidota bacterium]